MLAPSVSRYSQRRSGYPTADVVRAQAVRQGEEADGLWDWLRYGILSNDLGECEDTGNVGREVRVAGVRVVSLRDQDLSAAPPVRTRSREVISARRRGAKSVRSGGVPRGTTVLLLDAAYVSTALLLGPGDFMPTKGRPTIGRVVAALSLVAYGIALQHRLGRAEYVETESMVGA
ncbi:hypothetical protein ACCO45_008432 [Purpureocillium lilacinum]|uniref:Uncharacterized protein n=1 Tax=Purpureocillium lilacinum TaxID=33203 RepID=A0ACC4DQN4_PURLI